MVKLLFQRVGFGSVQCAISMTPVQKDPAAKLAFAKLFAKLLAAKSIFLVQQGTRVSFPSRKRRARRLRDERLFFSYFNF